MRGILPWGTEFKTIRCIKEVDFETKKVNFIKNYTKRRRRR
jgi:hypothetical protein